METILANILHQLIMLNMKIDGLTNDGPMDVRIVENCCEPEATEVYSTMPLEVQIVEP